MSISFSTSSILTNSLTSTTHKNQFELLNSILKAYNEMMEEARNIAIERMIEKAKSMGANAVIGMKIGTSAVMAGASEVIAYGTAVLIEE